MEQSWVTHGVGGELRLDDRLENEGDSQRNVCVSVHV